MATYKNFGEATRALKKNFNKARKKLPDILANVGTVFFTSTFKQEGFTDNSFQRWKPRQAGGKVKRKDVTRNILVKTGRLRRAVNNALTEKSQNRIRWVVNLPYAEAMNKGVNQSETVKAHDRRKIGKVKVSSIKTRKSRTVKAEVGKIKVRQFTRHMRIPARPFMKHSAALNLKFRKKIDQVIVGTLTQIGATRM